MIQVNDISSSHHRVNVLDAKVDANTVISKIQKLVETCGTLMFHLIEEANSPSYQTSAVGLRTDTMTSVLFDASLRVTNRFVENVVLHRGLQLPWPVQTKCFISTSESNHPGSCF